MRLPAKIEYGTLAMLTLAAHCAAGDHLQIKRIADEHQIPARFLVQILIELKRAGLVDSVRGASGGYHLARPAEQITLGDVIAALDNTTPAALPAEPRSPLAAALTNAWQGAIDAQQSHLDNITLAELVEQAARRGAVMWVI